MPHHPPTYLYLSLLPLYLPPTRPRTNAPLHPLPPNTPPLPLPNPKHMTRHNDSTLACPTPLDPLNETASRSRLSPISGIPGCVVADMQGVDSRWVGLC